METFKQPEPKRSEVLEQRLIKDIKYLYSDPAIIRHIKHSSARTGWDEKIKPLRAILQKPMYLSSPSFDYGTCFSYQILLNADSGDYNQGDIPFIASDEASEQVLSLNGTEYVRHWLEIDISILAPYYTYLLVVTRSEEEDKRQFTTRPYGHGELGNDRQTEALIRDRFNEEGYTLLHDDLLSRRVTGITLDLSEPDEVTVYKCLFSDYDSWPDDPILAPLDVPPLF